MCGFCLHLVNHTLGKVLNLLLHIGFVFFGIFMENRFSGRLVCVNKLIFGVGLQKGSKDARASSFLRLLELIPRTSQPPLMLFVENVVGFEVRLTKIIQLILLRLNSLLVQ